MFKPLLMVMALIASLYFLGILLTFAILPAAFIVLLLDYAQSPSSRR